jgi:siroheme synthase
VRDELLLRGIPAGRPVALVESASLEGERIVRGVLGDLPALAEKLGDGPTIMLIGDAFAEARAFASAVDAA